MAETVEAASLPVADAQAPVAGDSSIIDARTRWARSESDAAAHDDAGADRAVEPLRPASEPLRKAE